MILYNNPIPSKLSSTHNYKFYYIFRLTGAPNGYKYDTINFYEGELYNGAEQFVYGDGTSTMRRDNFGR